MSLPRIALLTVAVSLLTGCTSTITDDGVSGEASCAALIEYHGHRYWGQGHLERDARLTGRLVTGTVPGCDDTGGQQPAERAEPVKVAELVDVPLETAFRWNGDIFVREGRELPPL